jgi:hypothetical protein
MFFTGATCCLPAPRLCAGDFQAAQPVARNENRGHSSATVTLVGRTSALLLNAQACRDKHSTQNPALDWAVERSLLFPYKI